MLSHYAYIAMNRFTYGADKTSVASFTSLTTRAQAQAWLINQLTPYHLPKSKWTSEAALHANEAYRESEKQLHLAPPMLAPNALPENDTMLMQSPQALRKGFIEQAKELASQTALASINSEQALQAKLLDFFSNHFSVSRANLLMNLLAPTLEVEAIAPHLSHTFGDMLKAVIQHPAMLLYLNNERSVGPTSKVGKRQHKQNNNKQRGLNENLAREILELHTLGVTGGYSQNDVVELAKAITGWSIGSVNKGEVAGFMFRPKANEPGTRIVLGKRYSTTTSVNNNAQGLAILDDLAVHQACAKHISTKLAIHFIDDSPSAELVASMENTWIKSNGHIPSVMKTLLEHSDSWHAAPKKLKTPREFVLSSCRACGVNKPSPSLYVTLDILGQGLFTAGSPAGYPDHQEAWLGASALNSRIEWANHFAALVIKRAKNIFEPEDAATFALGPLLSQVTLQHVKRAESKEQALALLLMSPDFQWR